MRAQFFKPPILKRPLRSVHDAIICAVRDGDLRRAQRHFERSPAQYQAATLLCAFFSAERWRKTSTTQNLDTGVQDLDRADSSR